MSKLFPTSFADPSETRRHSSNVDWEKGMPIQWSGSDMMFL